MSNYHALTQTKDKKIITFVFHYTTPVGTNSNGIAYKDCIIADIAPTGSAVPDLETDDAVEYGKILAGEVYEQVIPINFDPDATNPQKLAFMESIWTMKNIVFQSDVQTIYKVYKTNGDVS